MANERGTHEGEKPGGETRTADGADDRSGERRTLLMGAGANFLGVAGKAIYPVFLFVALRLYSSSDFGDYLLSVAIFEVILRLAEGGVAPGVQMFVARHSADPGARGDTYRVIASAFWMTMATQVVLFVPLFTLGGWAAGNVWHKPQLASVMWILACGVPPAAVTAIGIGATKGLMVMRHDVLINSFIRPLVLLGCAAALSPLDLGSRGLAAAHTLSYVAAAVLAVAAYSKHFPLGPTLRALKPTFHNEYVRFAWAQNLNHTLSHLNAQLDIIMLGSFVSSAAVGFYGVGNRIAANLRQVKLSFGGIYSPLVARYHAQNRIVDVERTYWMISRWILMAVLPVLALALIYKDGLFRIFYGAVPYDTTFFLALLIGPFLSCAVGLSGNIILMAGYSWLTLINGLGAFGVNFALNALLIPRLDLLGAAVATMSASVIVSAAQIVEARVLLGVRTSLRALGKPLLAAAAVWALVLAVHHWAPALPLWAEILLGTGSVVLFYAVLWMLGLHAEDRQGLADLKEKLFRKKKRG